MCVGRNVPVSFAGNVRGAKFENTDHDLPRSPVWPCLRRGRPAHWLVSPAEHPSQPQSSSSHPLHHRAHSPLSTRTTHNTYTFGVIEIKKDRMPILLTFPQLLCNTYSTLLLYLLPPPRKTSPFKISNPLCGDGDLRKPARSFHNIKFITKIEKMIVFRRSIQFDVQ